MGKSILKAIFPHLYFIHSFGSYSVLQRAKWYLKCFITLIHQRADRRSKKKYNPAACGTKKKHSQKHRKDEKAEGYVPDEGTR